MAAEETLQMQACGKCRSKMFIKLSAFSDNGDDTRSAEIEKIDEGDKDLQENVEEEEKEEEKTIAEDTVHAMTEEMSSDIGEDVSDTGMEGMYI